MQIQTMNAVLNARNCKKVIKGKKTLIAKT